MLKIKMLIDGGIDNAYFLNLEEVNAFLEESAKEGCNVRILYMEEVTYKDIKADPSLCFAYRVEYMALSIFGREPLKGLKIGGVEKLLKEYGYL